MEKEYILKLKDELDNLSSRRQNMFNISTVIMTASVMPIFWKVTVLLVDKEPDLVCKNKDCIQLMLLSETLYLLFVSLIIGLFINIILKHKYISSVKYKILEHLIKNGDEDKKVFASESKILDTKYLNTNFTKISDMEILVLLLFYILAYSLIILLNIKIKLPQNNTWWLFALTATGYCWTLRLYRSGKKKLAEQANDILSIEEEKI